MMYRKRLLPNTRYCLYNVVSCMCFAVKKGLFAWRLFAWRFDYSYVPTMYLKMMQNFAVLACLWKGIYFTLLDNFTEKVWGSVRIELIKVIASIPTRDYLDRFTSPHRPIAHSSFHRASQFLEMIKIFFILKDKIISLGVQNLIIILVRGTSESWSKRTKGERNYLGNKGEIV